VRKFLWRHADEIAAGCITVVALGLMALPPEIGMPVLGVSSCIALWAYLASRWRT
jgi:hypothetical protein